MKWVLMQNYKSSLLGLIHTMVVQCGIYVVDLLNILSQYFAF